MRTISTMIMVLRTMVAGIQGLYHGITPSPTVYGAIKTMYTMGYTPIRTMYRMV